jgi:hypothetical protein
MGVWICNESEEGHASTCSRVDTCALIDMYVLPHLRLPIALRLLRYRCDDQQRHRLVRKFSTGPG